MTVVEPGLSVPSGAGSGHTTAEPDSGSEINYHSEDPQWREPAITGELIRGESSIAIVSWRLGEN